MKKSISLRKDMTIQDMMVLYVYRPYGDVLSYMVDDNERIHIKGDTWLVILDHHTGDFSFSGEISRYYDIDTITSIRDCFGDIYSIFNGRYDSVPKNTWLEITGEVEDEETKKRILDEETKKRLLEHKKEYYQKNRDYIRQRQREYYRRKKQEA